MIRTRERLLECPGLRNQTWAKPTVVAPDFDIEVGKTTNLILTRR